LSKAKTRVGPLHPRREEHLQIHRKKRRANGRLEENS
jgi:hypothetical protein